MIFGAGAFQVAGIQTAKKLGLKVITVDANPLAPGFAHADHYEVVSSTDTGKTLEIARSHNVEGVMTMSTETCVPSVAYVAEKLALPGIGIEASIHATNKLSMRECFALAKVPSPRFVKMLSLSDAEDILRTIGLPAAIKVPDTSGSRGFSIIEKPDQLDKAFREAFTVSEEGFVLVEEFMEGTEVGGEAFCYDGKMLMAYITNKKNTPPPYYIPLGHSLPSGLDEAMQDRIKNLVYAGIKALGIVSGPVNFDVMITREGPKIIELGARLGGNCLPTIVKYHSGIDTVEAAIRLAIGEDPSELFTNSRAVPVAVRLITSDKGGTLVTARFPAGMEQKPEVLEHHLDIKKGDPVHPFTCGAHHFGHVICQGRNWKVAEAHAEMILKDMELIVS